MNYKNIFRTNHFLLIAAASIIFILSSCNADDDLGEYYEGTFNDSIIILSEADTVNIILEQARTQFQKENIPFSIETLSNNTDTIALKLFVSFGSYNENPNPVQELNEISDTFYVWYSLRNKAGKILNKNHSIAEVNTSPRINYVSIDSVAVQRGTNKVVNFISRLIE
jgi:hypothetical protein